MVREGYRGLTIPESTVKQIAQVAILEDCRTFPKAINKLLFYYWQMGDVRVKLEKHLVALKEMQKANKGAAVLASDTSGLFSVVGFPESIAVFS